MSTSPSGRSAPDPSHLFHLVERQVWEQALRTGSYPWSSRGVSYADEGFVHLSRADQVAGTLNRFYADVAGPLVLLVVDPSAAGEIRVEGSFPHLYAPLPLHSVVAVLPVSAGPDGWRSPV